MEFVIVDGVQWHALSEWPTGLKDAAHVAEQTGMSEEEILELCERREMPHYRFNQGEPRFRLKEVKDWMVGTARAVWTSGSPFEHKVINYQMPPEATSPIPKELVNTKGLTEIPMSLYPSGVYFLCDGPLLVYIGQSVNPMARIAQHRKDKEFTHAFLLPIPESELDKIEGALIRKLNPKYNNAVCGAPSFESGIHDNDVCQEVLGIAPIKLV